jgi:hypothetical protein
MGAIFDQLEAMVVASAHNCTDDQTLPIMIDGIVVMVANIGDLRREVKADMIANQPAAITPYITTGIAYLRDDPSTRSKILKTLMAGQAVDITEIRREEGLDWGRVIGVLNGWIALIRLRKLA